MENATEALIMAGSIFLLIIALTLSISSFSRVKTQIDDIVLSREKVEYAVNSNDNSLLNFIQSNTEYTRTVTFETIATSLRRLRKENFDVYIIFKNTDVTDFADELQTQLHDNGHFGDIQVSPYRNNILRFTISGAANKYLEDKNSDNFDKSLNMLYNKVVRDNNNESKEFKEYYGVYKQKTDDGVSNIEKNDIKIITYVEKN